MYQLRVAFSVRATLGPVAVQGVVEADRRSQTLGGP